MAIRLKHGMGDVGSDAAASTAALLSMSTPSVNADYPSYCNWMPFADYITACQVPTAAVQNAAVKQQIMAAGDTPEAEAQYQAYLNDTAALAKLEPESAAQYQFAGENPNLAALLGADPFGRLVGGITNITSGVTSWFGVPAWVWLAGGLVTFAFVASGGGSARRYGR